MVTVNLPLKIVQLENRVVFFVVVVVVVVVVFNCKGSEI